MRVGWSWVKKWSVGDAKLVVQISNDTSGSTSVAADGGSSAAPEGVQISASNVNQRCLVLGYKLYWVT